MLKKIFTVSAIAILLLSGCTTNSSPEYDAKDYNQIKTVQTGVVVDTKAVVIKDDGSGKFIGVIVGAVLGSTIGHNAGKTLAVLGGGLAGGYAGGELGKANATELTIKLDNGETIVVVAKVLDIVVGDKVRIIKDGNKASAVNKIY